jgi:transcriptional regulator with XRE-family HTH domain
MTTPHKTQARLAARLGDAARKARLQARMTQADVAERIGVATEVYGRLERGMMLPSVPTLRKLCATLRVDANELLALDAGEDPRWMEEVASEDEDSPRLRRLLRILRRMDEAEISAMRVIAGSLLKLKEGRAASPGEPEPAET